jgi:Methyltransferase domain
MGIQRPMTNLPNAQYNFAAPDSLAIKVATRTRHHMFNMFMHEFAPREVHWLLDIGVTSDQSYTSSNYFEALYPHKHRIVATGLDDAQFLETLYPGVRYVRANALHLPFKAGSFDFVHSSAVLEHVGSSENQAKLIAECLRVARLGVCLTTPNRWFPIEVHTQLPLVHWLPKAWCRAFLRGLGYGPLAQEAHLNLMTQRQLRRLTAYHNGWRFRFAGAYLVGWKSNLILFAHRLAI